jgi:hypothetical protein
MERQSESATRNSEPPHVMLHVVLPDVSKRSEIKRSIKNKPTTFPKRRSGRRHIPTPTSNTAARPRDQVVPVTTAWRVLRLRMEERPAVWMAAANIWNKQSRTADKGWSSSLGVGRGANNFSP